MPELRHDLAQYYAAKSLFERILGRAAFMRVKDCGSLSAWRKNYTTLLRAVGVAAEATVEVADPEWRDELQEKIDLGVKRIAAAKSIDEIHASAAATFGEIVFLQLGFVPRSHHSHEVISLKVSNWKLSPVRTVQYVQSTEQRETQERLSRKGPRGKSET